ncbi:phosphatidate cytidylyltransferase [Aliiroseovarius sp. KMU-50]|uniref:Phosphatidate cytidylyltransferase n=1 Tax=Aliiroseovarius salicola TaxID=3009082 RepID=A0ABT4W2Z7_9RHOB|nr:phosphatidate cytidylyltransferase [Aliiroseovarius sp. KMU-50]MDA5094883.1 phosphatidate cytidylyltransferase [Aliiroseovarius sp. KMU-50]
MGKVTTGSNWTDLGPRLGAGLVMAVVAAGAIWAGGMVFVTLIALVIGLCFWELARLLNHPKINPDGPLVPIGLGVLATVAVVLAGYRLETYGNFGLVWVSLLAAPIVGSLILQQHRLLFGSYGLLIMLSALGFLHLSHSKLVIWLIMVVIVSDVAGYFAGRVLGGPKFWPKISPKKTWSGTVAGWIGAALVGLYFSSEGAALFWMIGSVLASFAGQMGDIAESAIKRFVGVKDSSNLIPGHGGVLDRFDAMIGAAALVYLLSVIMALPLFVTG